MNRLRQAFADCANRVADVLYILGDEANAWDSRAHPCLRLGDWIETHLADPNDLRLHGFLIAALAEVDQSVKNGTYWKA